jgi:phosphodiesterase/alkaline phosphatase D-like protein
MPLALLLAGLAPTPQKGIVGFQWGVACGDMAADSLVLWTRADRPARLTPEVDTRPDFATARALAPVEAGPASDLTAKSLVTGLAPGTLYYYRLRGPAAEASPSGTCHTAYAPDQAAPLTIGFTGDADWRWKPYPLLRALNHEPLDFFVFLGDLIYEWMDPDGNTVAETLDEYRLRYRDNREPRWGFSDEAPLRETYGRFGHYSVFDNHELGLSLADPAAPSYNEGGAPAVEGAATLVRETPGFGARVQAYDEYQPVRRRAVQGSGDARIDGTPGYYYVQPWGATATLIVADDRSYRAARLASSDDPAGDSPDRTMLDRWQLNWLEQALLDAQQRGVIWKLVVISSPIQEIGRPSEIGVELDTAKSWAGGYRYERDRLLQFIDQQGIDNVVFLTTDNHYTQINNLRYHAVPGDPASPRLPARNAFEILTGPLGASTAYPNVGAALDGLSGRAADRVEVATLVGDAPSSRAGVHGQKAAGLDPIGLEPDFAGLVAASVLDPDGTSGTVEPAAFAAYRTFGYAVLTVDGDLLTVRVEGLPAVDYPELADPAALTRYNAEEPRTIIRFQVRAR